MGWREILIKLTLNELLLNYKKYDFSYNVYIKSSDLNFQKEKITVILESDDENLNSLICEDEEYIYVSNIDVVYAVCDYLEEEEGKEELEIRRTAYLYYLKNDAFMEVSEK